MTVSGKPQSLVRAVVRSQPKPLGFQGKLNREPVNSSLGSGETLWQRHLDLLREVGAFAFIAKTVKIGRSCVIGPHVCIERDTP